MPVIAAPIIIGVKCKKCGAEVRSDWKFCPDSVDKITSLASTKPVSRNPDTVGIEEGRSN